ncbi:uncharacterized protein LOC144798029 [Lissotriton helveticus]
MICLMLTTYLMSLTSLTPPPKLPKCDSFNFEPVFDSEGLPMFDPSSIRHPNSTEWLPSNHVGEYISARLCLPLEATVRSRLKSECPKPALPDKITLVPSIDQPLLTFFSKFGKDPRRGVEKAWSTCQDKLLDIVGPLARIFDMAESARLDGSDLSAEDISMWVQRAFCLLGNANAAITHERRKGLLIKLDPKLANLAPMDPGSKANGLLFGENLVRDISRFVSTFASLDKAQQSIKKTFAPRVFGRAGRGRGRSSGRPYNQGSKSSYDNTQEYKPRFYPQRGRGFRGRGRQGYRNSNSNQPDGKSHFHRDRLSLTKTSHSNFSLRLYRLFKLHFSSSKEEQEVTHCHKPEMVQPLCGVSSFQNGDDPSSKGHPSPPRLDGSLGSPRRLSHCSYPPVSLEVSPIPVVRYDLLFHISPVWSLLGTVVLHETAEASGRLSSLSWYPSHNLLGRYPSSEFRQAESPHRSSDHSVSSFGLRISGKPREIFSGPFSEHGISGLPSGFGGGVVTPPPFQDFQNQSGNRLGASSFCHLPQISGQDCRSSFFFYSGNISGPPALPGPSTLEDQASSPRSSLLRRHRSRPRVPHRIAMVDRPFRCVERAHYLRHIPRSCVGIRCQSIGLGRPMWSNLDWRSMVKRGVQTAHKLFRDACWLLCNQKSFQRQDPLFHTLTHGQCFCGSLHKSSRRHKVQTPGGLSENVVRGDIDAMVFCESFVYAVLQENSDDTSSADG